uniref:Axonemal dynein heavy chain C n=1 Tax=Halisarca dujardinii TaxID=2583056 RepID=A0A9F1UC87_HALDU|nr:axonemal dynein heavy chain C [Halisarca dujardinii]
MADTKSPPGPVSPTRKVAQPRKHVRRGQVQKTRVHAGNTEDIKEKQQKQKEEREAKRQSLDARHQFVISTMVSKISMEPSEVEEFLLDGDQIAQMEDFFAANGSKALIFYYEEELLTKEEGAKPSVKKKLYLTDGTKEAFPGLALVFLRTTTKAITSSNVAQEVNFSILEANGGGILEAFETLLSSIFIPALKQQTNWGTLSADARGQQMKVEFLSKLSTFVSVLSNARASISDTVKLSALEGVDVRNFTTPAQMMAAAGNSELLEIVEKRAQKWCGEIEQILTESEQMRKEADTVGPRAELEHWKKRLAKFDCLTKSVKSPECRTVVAVLVAAKSKVLKTWKELDSRITDCTNEAKDNVKFLYTLEKYAEPLYKCNPVSMLDSIPGLMNTIRMINSYSRYYNTSERMTALLVKVTNQMITACRAYLTNDGYANLWEQDRQEVLAKLVSCRQLDREYQRTYERTKQKVESSPDERTFDFSEMYIFGKFSTFCGRLDKLSELLNTVGTYESLSLSRLDGIDTFNQRFGLLFSTLKKKPYDVLESRKADFEMDYDDFKRQLSDLNAQLQLHMDQTFGKIKSVETSLQYLKRFERLGLQCLDIGGRFAQILELFVKDMEFVQKQYNRSKDSPPLPRCMPPIAGRIVWVRQLYRRITSPVKLLEEFPDLMASQQAKKTIKSYNKLARVFVEYEMVYHQAWAAEVDSVISGLSVSVLVRHPDTGMLHVNFDQSLQQLTKETEYFQRLGLEVPPLALGFLERSQTITSNYNRVKLLLEEYNQLREAIPPLFEPLMGPHLARVDAVLGEGVTALSWSSLNIPAFVAAAEAEMRTVQLLLLRTRDILDHRINQLLRDMSAVTLCQLPDSEPWTVATLVTRTEELCRQASAAIDGSTVLVERAAHEVVALLTSWGDEELPSAEKTAAGQDSRSPAPPPSTTASVVRREVGFVAGEAAAKRKQQLRQEMQQEAEYLLEYFNHQNLDALLKLTRSTLETLRKRLNASSSLGYTDRSVEKKDNKPVFKASATLAIPSIIMKPSLEDIQNSINTVVQTVLGTYRRVYLWGQARQPVGRSDTPEPSSAGPTPLARASKGNVHAPPPQVKQLRNFHRLVTENKEVAKLVSFLSTTVTSSKRLVTDALEQFNKYQELWTVDRDGKLKEFMEGKPSISEFETEMRKYQDQEGLVMEEPDSVQAGAIALETENLKISLCAETKGWKVALGRLMNELYKESMEGLLAQVEDLSKRLSRPVKDLDDIRTSMGSLKELREDEIKIDMGLVPIEESYALLNKFQIQVTKEEMDAVDTMRYAWEKLNSLAVTTQTHLVEIQPQFKETLLTNVVQFAKDSSFYVGDYTSSGPMVEGILPGEASDRLGIYQARFDDLWNKYQIYTDGQRLFGIPVTESADLVRIKKELNLLQKLYQLYNQVMDNVDGYYDILWQEVDIEKINNELLDFQNKCRKLPKALKEWQAFNELKKRIDDFNETCPLLEMMANPAMKERHWLRLETLSKHKFDVESESFYLRNIMEAPLLRNKEDIEDICISAVKEKDIETKLKQVIADWSTRNLTFNNFKTRGELLLRGEDTSESISLMEDSLMVLGSLMSNRYNAPFKKEIQLWVQKLSNSTDIIERWMVVQNLWVYLEAVFVGGDIAKQLPKEAKRFSNIDKSWQKIMTRAHEVTNVVQCCVGDETLGRLLPHLLEQLELCQKSLSGYLEKKRLVFPRFFFVSDTGLLEILGQASDSHTIQAHLLGLFDNIKTVTFHDKEYDKILKINSREPETIELDKPVVASGNVETWLGALLKIAHQSVHTVIRQAAVAMDDPSFNLMEFLGEYPAQIGILGLQMVWTRDAEVAMESARTDKKIMQQTNQHFLDILNNLIEMTTANLTKINRTRYETIITIHVHQRDIFDDICKKNVKTPKDFEWLKQSRFYYQEEQDQCTISITDVDFSYQNEFLGCTERLVITPLTDRCYITLAQALGMSLGGAPAGPAGTGKTETVKDMGKALGKYVVVFNCSDQMDFRGLGRIYKGLAQSGSWGCFDEFNRIELPVLSVAAQQIAIVLQCKKERKPEFIFTDGDVVSLSPEFGLFLTMNPGYAGRQELPENLKINFRTVAMMVPDRKIIIRVKLASCGFLENIILAEKFYTLYKLCEEQLSKQVHYDFGLRNILSVLRTLGAFKRSNPGDSENKIVMRVLKDMNLSKLVDEDEPLFMSLIEDLFPGLTLEKGGYPDLEAAIEKRVREAGLISHPPWNLKLIQLFETQRVRHGMMVLGPSGAGKTCNINTLMRAMSDCGAPHREMRMNPKAITSSQMFGRLDVATNDWTDGIFSTLWRRTHKAKKGEHIWLVLDGPVDAIWIENLNSVLDDNKTLTLANGDRIPMAPDCKIVFEPHNIDNASPATVSRNGMVYMSSSALDWRPILQGWLSRKVNDKFLTAMESDMLMDLFDESFIDVYRYATTHLVAKLVILECNSIVQACVVLEGLLLGLGKEESQSLPKAHLERLYIFAVMWSVGALYELEDRSKMESFMRESTKLGLPVCEPGSGDTIFEFFVDGAGTWQHWSTRVEEYLYPKDSVPVYATILVPNVDNVRTDFLIQTVAKQEKAVLLIGEQGTAKTVIIQGNMSKYNIEEHLSKGLNFSSATQPGHFQRAIESYVDKRVGSTYGPPAGKKLTVFVDDVNMPQINEWGDQITNEIVRQVMEMKGFYSLDKPGDFTSLVDIQFMAATIHPGGGRNDIPSRLKRQFTIINCTLPSNASIDKIFGVVGCGYFCTERGFLEEVCANVQPLVVCTRKLWQLTKVKMLPTPAKFHYVFNLRDLSRIWEGMLHCECEVMTSLETLLALWRHECTRVVSDRFTNHEDKAWFQKAVAKVLLEEMGEEVASKLEEEPYFIDFLRDPPEPTGDEPDDAEVEAPKIYEHIPTWPELEERLGNFMAQLNETTRGSGMDLVFFKDAMVHLMKISRIIRTDRGNALLVGVGGSGKQSLTRLASFIAGYKTFQITLTRSYNANNLMEDLKHLYRVAGQQGKGITFIFTDQEIKDEGFLEYMNNLLSSGEISGLFARDEVDEICGELIPVMKQEYPRRPPTPENLYSYFLSRARQNLHVVLCFSPVGEKFRNRSLKFPGLISGCTMDWFSRWPKDALIAVAQHFLSSFDIACTTEVKQEVVQAMGVFQDFVAEMCLSYFERFRRTTHITPKSYLSFIMGYKTVYTNNKQKIGQLADRMNTGLNKLVEASESVSLLSVELVEKEKELVVANAKAEKVLAEVTQKAQAAEKVKAGVQVVKDKAQAIVDAINVDKKVAEAKLEKARPALEEAEAALQTIKPTHIATVRKLGKPPHLIMRIMDCVLLLFQKRIDASALDPDKPGPKPSWPESLKMMAQGGFLSGLQHYNKDNINEEMVELMQPYFDMEDYNFETAKRVCGDVAGLCSWTKAMASFYSVNKEVLPLKANLAIQEIKSEKAEAELAEAQGELDAKEAELNEVRALYERAMAEKQALQDDADSCKRRMLAATALISGLSGEKERWTQQSKLFADQLGKLVGDVLLASGFLSYAGPFNQEFRNILLDSWKKEMKTRKIPFSHNLNLIDMLADSTTIGEWNLQGLPNDELSVQNGIIVTKATRYPLLIDPQGQGKAWIKKKEGAELAISTLNHKYFRQHLEDALSLGRALLIEDVGEELDPCLDNVLEKNFIKSGTTLKVKVGDKEVDVMKGYMLYITTKLPNPTYTPEISARTSIIDFTVTIKGLEDQLLGRVILTEKNELEAERTKLMEDVSANKKKMQELEDNLLHRLTTTQGSLVDDESLITVLSTTKKTAQEVNQKLVVASETEAKINEAREEFRPVASRGSVLYFLIVEMSLVNVLYQTSLQQFLGVFDISMARSTKSPVTQKRIQNIIDYLTFAAFKYTGRGLYESHKFLFTLLLTLKIDMQSNKVRHQEFQTLIKGGAALDLNACPPKSGKWITDMTWLNLVELSKLPQFSEILKQVARNDKSWKAWFDSDIPEESIIPDGYNSSLDTFRKLLMIRSWCPDRVLPQARKYIAETMGKRYAEGVILDMEGMWEESKNRVPMICFLSLGSDPTNAIDMLARKKELEFRAISMGQGQEVHARNALQKHQSQGGWVLLQNCHLCLDFLEEVLLCVLENENVHSTFRLWVTTEVHGKFPINFLQACIKYTCEPPEGVKAGLRRTYTNISQEQLEISNLPQWKPMLYGVAFVHTTVQERRKFGPLGWNIPYEFNQGDLSSMIQFVQNHLDDIDLKKGVSWPTVRYMLGEIHYGGRVTDDFDKRLLNTYAKVWFGEHMFQPVFKFYKGYAIGVFKMVQEYLNFIDLLPFNDTAEIFGLHPNADITYQSNTAKQCLDEIVNIQPKDSSGGGGETREAVVSRQAVDMLEKLPSGYIPHEVRAKLKEMGALAPMNIFLRQEIDRMQRVIVTVRSTLLDLQLAIDGTIIMSETLRDTLDSMYDARVPKLWQKISWDSSTIGFWYTELLDRDTQFRSWVFQGRPRVFWMTGFFNPQGFLTAMRQEVTRAHKGWALDSVVLHNDVTKMMKDDITAAPPEGVYVYGLFLDGAGWDKKNVRLIEPTNKVLFCPLPVVHIYAVNSLAMKDPKLYQCPVYTKPRRTDLTYITTLLMKTGPNPDHWVLRGVALLCDIK